MMFDCPTIKEIDEKLKRVSGNPEFYIKKSNARKKWLRGTEFLNSFLIEHPEYYNWGGSPRDYKKKVRVGVKRLQEAWDYIKKLDSPLVNSLSKNNILDISRKVDPKNVRYRDCRVSLMLRSYVPPNYLKIEALMDTFLKELKSWDLHPLEQAAFAHSRIAAIQPFFDGNKRTARLIQNKILSEQKYPYATIPLAERGIYIDLLEESMCAYRNHDVKKMGPFFNYIARKVNNNLDEIILGIGENKRRFV